MSHSQARYWLLTIPHYAFLPYLPPACNFVRGQLERGHATDYIHWQLLVLFKQKVSLFSFRPILTFRFDYEPLRMYSAIYVTPSQAEAPPPTPTSGRTTPPSPVLVLNLGNAQQNETTPTTGTQFGMPPNAEDLRRFPRIFGSVPTTAFAESPWTTSRRNLSSELLSSIGDQQEQERAEEHGTRLVGTHTPRSHALNSGMDTRDRNMSSWTNLPGRSQLNTYYDGSIDTPLTSRQRGREWFFVPYEYGSPATSTPGFGIHQRQRNNAGR